jgi:hypothetical protein
MKTKKIKRGKYALESFRLYWEFVPGDRGKRFKVPKLKRPPVHYVLGKRLVYHSIRNRAIYWAVSKFSKDLRGK